MKMTEFFRRWGQGIKDLSPRKQLETKRVGLIGTIVGVTIGGTMLALKGSWYFLILMFFIIVLQSVDLIHVNQQIRKMKSFEVSNDKKNQ